MYKKLLRLSFCARKGMLFILASCWFAGLLCGAACCCASSPDTISLMRRAVSCPVSIVGLLQAALIPFLLSALSAVLSLKWLTYFVCLVKAFLFSFVSVGLLTACGSGGWLLRLFLMFGDCAALPFLYWCWSCIPRAHTGCCFSKLIVTGCVLVVAIILNYRVIAPIVCLIDFTKG